MESLSELVEDVEALADLATSVAEDVLTEQGEPPRHLVKLIAIVALLALAGAFSDEE